MASLKFAHVAMNCNDPVAIEKFYTRYFGFQRARLIPLGDDQIVFLKSDNVYLELFKAKDELPAPKSGGDGPLYPGLRHLAFQVDDVDAKLKELAGVAEITQGPMNFDSFIPGWRTVWIADPEGNIIEISQGYMDQKNPPPLE
ncbi:MAG: VOC family protein [bacterium]